MRCHRKSEAPDTPIEHHRRAATKVSKAMFSAILSRMQAGVKNGHSRKRSLKAPGDPNPFQKILGPSARQF